jgi:hypothetical protein
VDQDVEALERTVGDIDMAGERNELLKAIIADELMQLALERLATCRGQSVPGVADYEKSARGDAGSINRIAFKNTSFQGSIDPISPTASVASASPQLETIRRRIAPNFEPRRALDFGSVQRNDAEIRFSPPNAVVRSIGVFHGRGS